MLRSGPRTEVYLRSDISNVLQALHTASRSVLTIGGEPADKEYRAGFAAALQAVAEAFGVQRTFDQRSMGSRLSVRSVGQIERSTWKALPVENPE